MFLLKYTLKREYNVGTPDAPDMRTEYEAATLTATSEDYDIQMAFAKAESYNGEVTVEDIPDPERDPTAEERIAELEAVNAELEDAMCEMDASNQEEIAALNETVSALEDAVCEMDAANEERMAAIEDALCDIDMG